jgi:hypothetical protein
MQNPSEAPQRGRLAGAVLPKHDQQLAGLDVQVDSVDGAHVAEALA